MTTKIPSELIEDGAVGHSKFAAGAVVQESWCLCILLNASP